MRAIATDFRRAGKTARSLRQTVQTVHLWAGIILSIPMILIGLTGSALLVQREILRLSVPAASASGESRSIAEIIAAAQTAIAPGIKAAAVELPVSSGRPASVQFIVATRPTRTVEVHVDPVSLKVLGSSELIRRGPIMSFLVNIHEFLMMPSSVGLRVVGWMAVAMTLMGLSGLYLWWPRNGRWLKAFGVRRGARGLPLHLDLHHAIGAWGLVLFLILSVSGIYLVFPQTVSRTLKTVLPFGATQVNIEQSRFPRNWPIDADQGVAFARAAMPDARVKSVQLSDARLIVLMEPVGVAPSVPAITIVFDPKNEDFVSVDDPRHYPTSDRVMNLLYAMHFSLGLGRVWTVLVFVAGVLPLALAITGVTIWMMKRRARRSNPILRRASGDLVDMIG